MEPRDAVLVELPPRGARRALVTAAGGSLAPLLRAGMVVDIEPLAATPRSGDILVLDSGDGLVAQRLNGGERFLFRAQGGLITGTRPEVREHARADLVIGRVGAIWTNAAPDARRVPVRIATPRRRPRAAFARLRALLALGVADPTAEAPPAAFAALTAATRSFERREYGAAVAHVTSVPAADLVAMARRHHAGGLLAQWFDEARAAGIAVDRDLHAACARLRWTNALQAGRVLDCVREVRDAFEAASIPHIFLKGGARLAGGQAGADRQYAGDLDVLVPAACAAAALSALRRAGYRDVRHAHERSGYAALHHREPLVSPRHGVPVEVHVALTPPAIVSRPLDFVALQSSARRVRGPAGYVCILDEVGAALHLAYHARDVHVWRDIVLLSRLLRGFDRGARARFDAAVRAEKRDGLRLRSAVAAAEALSAGAPPPSARVRRYLAWVEFREDLPRRFAHVDVIEAAVGRCPIHVLRLDHTRRDGPRTIRRLMRNALALPAILRLAGARRRARMVAADC